MQRVPIELTGNPFVDAGLSVIAYRAGVASVQDLTTENIAYVFGDGRELADCNSRLKSFTMIFTKNSLLTNASIRPTERRNEIYRGVLEALLESVGERTGELCECCGAPCAVDFTELVGRALAKFDMSEKPRNVGRDWFPLAGTFNDAQALPSGSRALKLCGVCLFAVHYLPQGVLLVNGRLACFSSTWEPLRHKEVVTVAEQIGLALQAGGPVATLGQKEGSRVLARYLLDVFQKMRLEEKFNDLPKGTALVMWRFTNSGASAELNVHEIPDVALRFLHTVIVETPHGEELRRLLNSEGKNPHWQLMHCVEIQRDYYGLYPATDYAGASPGLYCLYQVLVMGRRVESLKAAYRLARRLRDILPESDYFRLQRREAFKEAAAIARVKGAMIDLAAKGEFTLHDYLSLIATPSTESGGGTNWDALRYFLVKLDEPEPNWLLLEKSQASELIGTPDPLLVWTAATIYNDFHQTRGRERFKNEVLDCYTRGKLRLPWLRNRFVKLAERLEGFTFVEYVRLLTGGGPYWRVAQILYQMQLLFWEWYAAKREQVDAGKKPQVEMQSDVLQEEELPEEIGRVLCNVCNEYVQKRGLTRFKADVLDRMAAGEIGINWVERKIDELEESVDPDLWSSMLHNHQGLSIVSARLFQIRLYLANYYRHKKNEREVNVS